MAQKDISKNISSAADLEQILQISYAQKGVSVLDVYSSEWGTCKAIAETFRRMYTEAGEAVHLRFFTVECNAVLESLRTEDPAIARHQRPKNTEAIKETLPDFWVPILEKRRGKSKPFFVMYKEGRKMYEVDGVNTPLLRAYVKDLCTVKTPASEFIQQQKLLEFWEENFNPDESEVPLEKFMRVMTVVCKLAVSLTEEEKAVLFEALGIRKDSKEKIVTAEALQKWIGEDETRSISIAFAETLPEYEVRAAQARAEREAEERKRQEQLRKEREEQARREEEERAAAEAERRKLEEAAIAASYQVYTAPSKDVLDSDTAAVAVSKLDDAVAAAWDIVHARRGGGGGGGDDDGEIVIKRPVDTEDNAAAWKFIQDTVADSANTTAQRRVKSVPFLSVSDAQDQAAAAMDELEKASPSLIAYLTSQKLNVPLPRVAAAAFAFSEKAGGADAKASVVGSFARALSLSSAEDSAKFFGMDLPFVDFAGAVQSGAAITEQSTLAATLLFLCAEQCPATNTYYAILKPDGVPDGAGEAVLPVLTILSSSAPENVPDNRVCVAVQGLTSIVDLSLKNGQTLAASAWYVKGSITPNDPSTGFTTFVAQADQTELAFDDKRAALQQAYTQTRITDDTFLRAYHHVAVLRQLRREYAAKLVDPFWTKFQERLPYKPKDAVRELFNSLDGDNSGGLTVAEVSTGVSKALEIPAGDDISPAVQLAFDAVRTARTGAGKAVSDDANRVGLHELSLCVQYLRMYYELLAMFKEINTGSAATSRSDRNITPDELSKAADQLKEWGTEIDETTFEAIDTSKNGKISFVEFAEWAIKQRLDLTEDDEATAEAAAEEEL